MNWAPYLQGHALCCTAFAALCSVTGDAHPALHALALTGGLVAIDMVGLGLGCLVDRCMRAASKETGG